MIRRVNTNPDYAPVGFTSELEQTAKMEFDADQRRQALQAFMEREGLKPAPWEKQAKIGDGTVRKFLAGQSGTLTDRTYHALAVAAAAMRGRAVTAAELQGAAANGSQSPSHNSETFGREPLRKGDNVAPPLLLYRAAGAAPGRQGGFMLYADRVGEVERPDFLQFSDKAFATRIIDDRNAPAYRRRDVILVDPDSPPIEDEDCLFLNGGAVQNGTVAVVGCLISSTVHHWKIREYALKGERDLPKAEFPDAWPIVGRYNRR